MPSKKAVNNPAEKGWRKAVVAIVGIVALCYGATPGVNAVSPAQFYAGVILLAAGFAGINIWQKLKLPNNK